MKKILLASAVALVASSAMASENTFYVRADVGAAFMPKANLSVKITGAIVTAKQKRTNHIVADLGVGTYLMDNVRVELDLSNNFNAKQSGAAMVGTANLGSNSTKVRATSLHLKALVDIVDYGYGKVFAGAGVGLTQLSAKSTYSANAAAKAVSVLLVPAVADPSFSVKAKKKNNVSFLATVGTSFDVSEGVMLDVAYAYTDHGKTKNFDTINSKFHFKTHAVTAGVRIEL